MTNRQCAPCTACCEGWLTAEIHGIKVKPGSPCVHCTSQGCDIYESRPVDPCVNFECFWLREPEKLPENMKPSECGAIVLLAKMFNRQIINAIPVGKTIPADTIEWLMAFAREYSIPLVFNEYLFVDGKYHGIKRTGYGPPSFVRMVEMQILPEDIMML